MKLFQTPFFLALTLALAISFFQSEVNAQDQSDSIFTNDALYHKGLEEKVLAAFNAQQGKTVPQLQLEARSLKNEQAFSWKIEENPSTEPLKPKDLFRTKKSTVFLMGRLNQKDRNDYPYADLFASAFAISSDGICVTNYHVLGELIHTDKPTDSLQLSQDLSTYFIETIDGEVYVMDKLLAFSSSNDVAIFKVKTNGKKLPFIPLGPVLLPGEPVYIISHPDHIYYYLSEGIVNKNSLMLNPRTPGIRQYRMTISADYAVGSSGAPILSEAGNLAGVVSSTQTIPSAAPEGNKQQMVMKNAISVRALKLLIL
ncbi:serine protease [Sphingobacterium sp.]|uniref:S1 family peptidase n=1 Tax=Sphingobacterium sp. TaxID=341027 RepID=UPI0028AD3D60|nr:serine protease [Sphingobacterium sp.]